METSKTKSASIELGFFMPYNDRSWWFSTWSGSFSMTDEDTPVKETEHLAGIRILGVAIIVSYTVHEAKCC